MPSIQIVSMKNEPVGELMVSDQVFGGRVNSHLLWESMRQKLASDRSGTAKVKTRAEVSGAGRKLWRQKGTGRARVGSIRSPLWRHGGTVHGPVPRDYAYTLPKKAYRSAIRSALAQKLQEGDLIVLADLTLDAPRTKLVHALLTQLGVTGKALFVTADAEPALEVAVRNHPRAVACAAKNVTAFELLASDKLIVTQDAIRKLEEAYAR